jgi:carbamoyl-phosphate synthase large subunit
MKSVGEVMGIGRSFQEAFIKLLNLEIKRNGLGADGKGYTIMNKLSRN